MAHHKGPAAAWYLDAAPAAVSRWTLRLHLARASACAITLALAFVVSSDDVPLHRVAPLLAASGLIQIDIALRLRRGAPVARAMTAASLAVDTALLTGLLELSGGPSNPFAVIYAVQVVVAWAILGSAWAVGLGAFAVAGLGTLIYWHLGELVPSHHRLVDLPTHLFTMWLALATMAEGVAHFIRESTSAIARREAALDEMRAQAARTERLMSLTTLAAGAAHELSTPLATVAVASHELERALASAPGVNTDWIDDARLIREQVERCHVILDQMSGRAVGPVGEGPASTAVPMLFDELRHRLPPEQAARIQMTVDDPTLELGAPRAGLVQVLLSLVKNAFDASAVDQPVLVEGKRTNDAVQLIVTDRGAGMSSAVLERAGEPFFTTKEPGRGMGLGLFLARMFAERCGGTLTVRSDRGTIAVLELPLARPATSA